MLALLSISLLTMFFVIPTFANIRLRVLLVRVCVLVFLFACSVARANELPKIASINMCTDQLVLLLADPEQILSLSFLSHDPSGSFLYEQAREYPTNRGSSEQMLSLQPDVILAGQYSAKHTVKLLTEQGMRIETLPIANSLDDLFANIDKVARWVGHEHKGQQLITELKARVTALQKALSEKTEDHPTAAYYGANGYTVGGNTLRGQALELSGWTNVAAQKGIEHFGALSLESMIKLAPQALVDSPYSEGTYSRAQQLVQHPALKASGLDPMIINVPSRQTICAGPWTVDLIEHLFAKRTEYFLQATKPN